jgi:hypothetical protein
MQEVIIWTVTGGSLVFVLGLISAFEARRQRESKPRVRVVVREAADNSSKRINTPVSAMSMAASGVANGEENLASVGSSAR